jgi:predicted MFS family arabinose efflux permease
VNDTSSVHASPPTPVPASTWYALAVLTLIYAGHYLDRTMISILVEPIRREFHLADSQLGLLTGLAYGASFALAGLPFGYLIDRVNRRRLLASVVVIWSSMTALVGVAQTYSMLLTTRVLLGAAEAGGTPAAMAMISDLFPARLRSTALGIYYLGTGIGAAASAVIGAVVAMRYGWRAAFFAAGLPGIVLGVLVWATMRDVPRGAGEARGDDVNTPRVAGGARGAQAVAAQPAALQGAAARVTAAQAVGPQAAAAAPPALEVILFLLSQRAVVSLVLAVSLTAAGMAAIGAWLPALLMRNHGMTLGHAGLATAVAFGLFSSLGTLIGGLIADRLARRGASRRLWFCAAMALLAVPAGVGAALAPNAGWAVGLTFVAAFSGFTIFPSGFGTAMALMPAQMRGMTTACAQVVSNLVGYGVGPYAVGLLSALLGGTQSLQQGMAIVCAAAMTLAAVALVLGARWHAATLARAETYGLTPSRTNVASSEMPRASAP